jgi:hypothetical protein
MKTCKDIVALATEYLEGGMEEEARREFERHIECCPPCVGFFKTYRATGPICRKAIAQRLPPEVKTALWQFLEKRINSEE